MAQVFVDTSAIYALIDRGDANHAAARKALEKLRKLRGRPLVTNFIVAEGHALLLSRLGADIARKWISSIVWPIERVSPEDEDAALKILRGQVDKTYSYTNATSFAVMQRLRITRVLAFDRHFTQFGFETV